MHALRHFLMLALTVTTIVVSFNATAQERPQTDKDPHQSHQSPQTKEASPAQQYFTDVVLVSQNGQQMRLYSDLLKGKIVVINAFFTSCKDTCPIMAHSLAVLQEWLGDRLGKDVYLISISVDPETDTPAKLLEYADRFKARPGWFFLTGKKQDVNQALNKLGQYVEVREDHLNIMIMGNEPTGLWKKAMGLAKPEELIKILDSLLKDKG
jgi:protein SCO1/2